MSKDNKRSAPVQFLMKQDYRFYSRLFAPMLAVFIGGYMANRSGSTLCGNNDDIYDDNKENKASFQPSDSVFTVAWIILTLHIGAAWVVASKKCKNDSDKLCCDVLISVIVILLAAWPSTYRDYKETWAVWLMYIILLLVCIFAIVAPQKSRVIISPLAIWLLFAISLLQTELSNTRAQEMHDHLSLEQDEGAVQTIYVNKPFHIR
mgnify:CR=1 FL=1